jgi:CspA family cold shock protein
LGKFFAVHNQRPGTHSTKPRRHLFPSKIRDVNFTVKGAPYRHCQPKFESLSSNINSGDREMARGTVKWFNSQKGYGFIQPESGGKDMFVHISAVEKAGLSSLNEGQVVEYEEVADKGKTSAQNLKVQR